MLEDRLHNFDDIVFSCFLPDDWLNEFRMPQHVLVYVYVKFTKLCLAFKNTLYLCIKYQISNEKSNRLHSCFY